MTAEFVVSCHLAKNIVDDENDGYSFIDASDYRSCCFEGQGDQTDDNGCQDNHVIDSTERIAFGGRFDDFIDSFSHDGVLLCV